MTTADVTKRLVDKRLPLQNEKLLQAEVAVILPEFKREYRLSDILGKENPRYRIDFFHEQSGIGIEIKINGSRKDIWRQVALYCHSDEIKVLILVTNKSMGLPEFINHKPCFVINLGTAWL